MIEVTRVSDQLGPLPNHRNDELPRCASDIPVQLSKKMNRLNQRKARASGLTESRRSAISKLLATSRLGTFQGDLLLFGLPSHTWEQGRSSIRLAVEAILAAVRAHGATWADRFPDDKSRFLSGVVI